MFELSWTEATFWVAAVACVVAQAAIVRSVFVARPPEGGDVPLPRPAPARRAPEVAWAVVPALALAAVLALTWRAIHEPPAGAAPNAAPVAEV